MTAMTMVKTTIMMMGVILGIAVIGFKVIGKWDTPLSLDSRCYLGIGAAALLEGLAAMKGQECSRLLLAGVGGSLLLACVTDVMICHVYRFSWWPALAAAIALLGRRCCQYGLWDEGWYLLGEMLKPLCVFLFLQFTVFRRMYGKADYYAFCICAIVETAGGMELTGYLMHMLLAYGLLFPVQALRRNINVRGNLKKPVPFLPYITAAFWLTVIFMGNFT